MESTALIKERRSVRKYEQREVPRHLVEEIIDCGRLAATANNKQPWVFIAVTEAETRGRIAALTDYGKFIAEAPVCIAVFCKRTEKYYLEDGSAATQNMLLAATALGLGSCWVAGDKKKYAEGVRLILGVPEEFTLVSLIPVGYPADRGGRASKRSLADVLRWERY